MIDDNPLTSINVQWLRSTVGLVNQQPVLLPGTIHDNIAVGKSNATRAEVEEAAALANADQFIMALDDGYAGLAVTCYRFCMLLLHLVCI